MLTAFMPVRVVGATPISISVPTLFIEALLFLGMVFLMEKLVFAPIRAAWKEREDAIQAGLRASTEGRDEAQEARDEVRRILGEARREAQQTIDAVTTEGERLRTVRVEEATAEFQRLLAEARSQIQSEQQVAAGQVRTLVIDLALDAAAKVTGAGYDNQNTRELAAAAVAREGFA